MAIHFNEYGQTTIPEDILEAQRKYWEVIKPHLDEMTPLEIRAFEGYTSLELEFASYLLRRAMELHRKGI